MKTISIAIAGLVLLDTTHQTTAQTAPPPAERITVSSLMNQGYDLVGAIAPASGGSGLFLRKGCTPLFLFHLRDAAVRDRDDTVLQANRTYLGLLDF
jgi:hypothetical protein